jgi:hypothetical protein
MQSIENGHGYGSQSDQDVNIFWSGKLAIVTYWPYCTQSVTWRFIDGGSPVLAGGPDVDSINRPLVGGQSHFHPQYELMSVLWNPVLAQWAGGARETNHTVTDVEGKETDMQIIIHFLG